MLTLLHSDSSPLYAQSVSREVAFLAPHLHAVQKHAQTFPEGQA